MSKNNRAFATAEKVELRRDVTIWGSYTWGYADVGADIYVALGFDLLTNIMEARVTANEGWLILAVRGKRASVEQGLAWIAEQGVQVDVLAKMEEET